MSDMDDHKTDLTDGCGLETLPMELMMSVCGGLSGVVMLSCTSMLFSSIVPIGTRLDDVYQSAIVDGHISILEWLCAGNQLNNKKLIQSYAARVGNIAIIRWVKKRGDLDLDCVFAAAAAVGNLEMIRQMRVIVSDDGSGRIPNIAALEAAKQGHLHILAWIYQYVGIIHNATDYAAEFGSLDTVKWMVSHHFPCYSLCNAAARGGKLETLKWLFANGYPISHESQYNAVRGGHLDILKWFYEKGIQMTSISEQYASKHEHILSWLKEIGVPIKN